MALKILEKFKNNSDGDIEDTFDESENNNATINGIVKKDNTMILLEPRAYSESQQIADYLKANSSVVVNLRRVTPDQAKRIVDFLSGTIYAIGGDLQKLGGGIFLCTPQTVNVEGKISDDGLKDKNQKNQDPKKQGKSEEEEDEFNW